MMSVMHIGFEEVINGCSQARRRVLRSCSLVAVFFPLYYLDGMLLQKTRCVSLIFAFISIIAIAIIFVIIIMFTIGICRLKIFM